MSILIVAALHVLVLTLLLVRLLLLVLSVLLVLILVLLCFHRRPGWRHFILQRPIERRPGIPFVQRPGTNRCLMLFVLLLDFRELAGTVATR